MLRLHAFFHLNLMFSSIEEESRPAVIERCYWPILRLAEKLGRPIGIEATGFTLEEIERLDAAWIAKCRELIGRGLIEPIGSGYAQVIAPLFPAELTRWNLKLGHAVYDRLFGRRPRIALINEQAYSAGILPLYAEAGYQAILMDWDMCAYAHSEWDSEWRYHVQLAQGQGAALPVIWTNTVVFQKLQRLAHGEIELDEYVEHIASRIVPGERTLALYSNDAEVFDFRPGRYKTEASSANKQSEWKLVEAALERLLARADIEWISTFDAMTARGGDEMHQLKLESAAFPVPVKKQMKYNVSRWAVTGRADFEINRRCRALVKRLMQTQSENVEQWRRLCWLASSDFRTHITEKRFTKMLAELKRLEDEVPATPQTQIRVNRPVLAPIRFERGPRKITVASDLISLDLNPRKGLAISRLHFADHDRALIGTVPHGAYDDVVHAFDWFSGTLISEFIGQPKWTDLSNVDPQMSVDTETGTMTLKAVLPAPGGDAIKLIEIARDEPKISVRYILPPPNGAAGTLRLGNITLLPEAADSNSLYFETHNGGEAAERFALSGQTIDHGEPVSFLVSASAGLGMTDGSIVIGDAKRAIRIAATEDSDAFLGLVTHRMVKGKVFCRVSLSAGELDETRRPWASSEPLRLGYTISPA